MLTKQNNYKLQLKTLVNKKQDEKFHENRTLLIVISVSQSSSNSNRQMALKWRFHLKGTRSKIVINQNTSCWHWKKQQ